ncbi:MerR family transcriptional regulator [Acinetobacter sp.]|uniref:MerR family transcriptional regulator n=1 Tax=Acinetobacter sp. TaxID=472 RepID=UPI00282FCD97|nr:MerR family transcriptional regulator [Acinetobacter sp.]MDR0237282.1 MerR family transcriptional regulator [Acinetobacter sp.]
MNISQFSKKHGVSPDTLRFYEELKILVPNRLKNGYRNYQEHHEQQIKLIIALKSIGFSLIEIKHILELSQQPASETCNILSNQLIDEKLAMIHQHIQLLEYGKNTLEELKRYIKDNTFIENQPKIEVMIENLYQLSKKSKTQ